MKLFVNSIFLQTFSKNSKIETLSVNKPIPAPTPSTQIELEKLNLHIQELTSKIANTGTHWGLFASLVVSIGVAGFTLWLLHKQSETMAAQGHTQDEQKLIMDQQTRIMKTQSEINSKLVSIEESREHQANFVAIFTSTSVNLASFNPDLTQMVPFKDAFNVKVHVVNESNQPIFAPIFHFKNDGILRYDDSKEPVAYYEPFGTVGPHRTKEFVVSGVIFADNARYRDQAFPSRENAQGYIGIIEDDYRVTLQFTDSGGNKCGRDWDGNLVQGRELDSRREVFFPEPSEPIKGYWETSS